MNLPVSQQLPVSLKSCQKLIIIPLLPKVSVQYFEAIWDLACFIFWLYSYSMGSKRNKENRHVDRGKFKKRVSPNSCNKKPKRLSLNSSRIIKLKNLDSAIQSISAHAATCPGCLSNASSSNQAVSLLGETDRKGLASVLTARCNYCKEEINFQTSSKVCCQKGASRWEHNLAAVWGEMRLVGGLHH